ncbi:MAG: GGDEF domain-containing protein [Planctomycetes bacterium]|nr:GGDEF domain-containing protein [Planctomycetota bacterium]
MTTAPVVVVLTDGEANLAHFMNLLRDRGYRVLATARSYEAVLFVARNQVTAVLLRSTLLPDPPEDFLRQLRDFSPSPFITVSAPGPDIPNVSSPLVDLWLSEPYRFSALVEALDYGTERCRERGMAIPLPRGPERPSQEGLTDPRLLAAAPRLIACSRLLSELERDRDQLLTTGLEMFLELADAERGSIMLKSPQGDSLELERRSGFPDDVGRLEPTTLGESLAGEVALTGRPLLVEDVDPPTRPDYEGRSFMIVPLMDRRTVLGVVNLTDRRGGEVFTQDDVEVVSLLASQMAVNLINADKWEDLHRMAVVDPLTGLFNRRFFDRQISIELERAKRYDRQLTLALLDIDNFKVINDLNGYATGDAVIRSVAEIIQKNFREVDVVTRWGGDEFAVLLPETGKPIPTRPGDAPSVNYIERVRCAVDQADFRNEIPNLTGRITVSAGAATYPVDAPDQGVLFSIANQALIRAKRAGNNRVCVAGDDSAGVSDTVT